MSVKAAVCILTFAVTAVPAWLSNGQLLLMQLSECAESAFMPAKIHWCCFALRSGLILGLWIQALS